MRNITLPNYMCIIIKSNLRHKRRNVAFNNLQVIQQPRLFLLSNFFNLVSS